MKPLSRRRFIGIIGLAAGAVVVSKQLNDRLRERGDSIIDMLDLDSTAMSDELLELGRAVNEISPESVDRLEEESGASIANADVGDMLAAAARSRPDLPPVSIEGWLLADPIAGPARTETPGRCSTRRLRCA